MGTPATTTSRLPLDDSSAPQQWRRNGRFRRSALLLLALVPLLSPLVSPHHAGPFVYAFCMVAHLLAGWSCYKASTLHPQEKIRWQTVALAQGVHAGAYALAAQRDVAWIGATDGAWLGIACISASLILMLPALMGVRAIRGKWVRALDYLLAAVASGLMARAISSGADPGNGTARLTVITLVVLALTLAALLARATSVRPGIKWFSTVMSQYLLATLFTYLLLDYVLIDWLRSANTLLSNLLIAAPELWLCDLALKRHQEPAPARPELEPVLVDSFQPSILVIGGMLLALYGFRNHAVIAGASIILLMLCYALRTQLFYYQLFTREKQLRVQANRMEELATRDPLTGIANRRWFDEEAARLLLAERSYPCSLLLVDTDRFKDINDAHGHLVGDEVLRTMAAVLSEVNAQVKRGCCARIGGDEFGMLWPGTGTSEAVVLGELVRTRLAEKQPSGKFQLTASIGVATAQQSVPLLDLMRRADHALYSAKAAGRNTVRCENALYAPASEPDQITRL